MEKEINIYFPTLSFRVRIVSFFLITTQITHRLIIFLNLSSSIIFVIFPSIMATTTTRIFSFVLMMMSFTVLMGCCSSAKTYKVGDSEGWKPKADTYHDWLKDKEFHVGDSLIFE